MHVNTPRHIRRRKQTRWPIVATLVILSLLTIKPEAMKSCDSNICWPYTGTEEAAGVARDPTTPWEWIGENLACFRLRRHYGADERSTCLCFMKTVSIYGTGDAQCQNDLVILECWKVPKKYLGGYFR